MANKLKDKKKKIVKKDDKDKKKDKTKSKVKKNKKDSNAKIIFLFMILFTVIIFIESNIFLGSNVDNLIKSDALIILETEKIDKDFKILDKRIHKAYDLYKKDYGISIITTGSQSEYMTKKLLELGVSKQNILIENGSKNIYESLKNTKDIMSRNRLENGVIVGNYYNLFRGLSIGKELNMKLVAAKADMPESNSLLIYTNISEVLAIIEFYILNTISIINKI